MIFHKFFSTIIGTFALVSDAAIVNFYKDRECNIQIGSRNIWDNTCAKHLAGFQSLAITTAGGSDQSLTTFSLSSCTGPETNCIDATALWRCFATTDKNGGSNAIASGKICEGQPESKAK